MSSSGVSHQAPVWPEQGMKMYYAEARIDLKMSNMNYVVQRVFRDTKNLVTTQQFFVKSFGNAVLWAAPEFGQFKHRLIVRKYFFQKDLDIKTNQR